MNVVSFSRSGDSMIFKLSKVCDPCSGCYQVVFDADGINHAFQILPVIRRSLGDLFGPFIPCSPGIFFVKCAFEIAVNFRYSNELVLATLFRSREVRGSLFIYL